MTDVRSADDPARLVLRTEDDGCTDGADVPLVDAATGAVAQDHAAPGDADSIDPSRRLIRLPPDRGLSLGDRLTNELVRWTWRTPLYARRLRGRYPLKLLGVPADPCLGDIAAGKALRLGYLSFRGLKVPLDKLDFAALNIPRAFADHLHRFGWLRDLAASGPRAEIAPLAERLTRAWLAVHGNHVTDPAWQPDNTAWRVLAFAAHAPILMRSGDLVHRSAVLNHIARCGRHLDHQADRCPPGLGQMVAWVGVVAVSLLIPGGEARRIFGEAGLRKAIEAMFFADGGNIARSPKVQIDALAALVMLGNCYGLRGEDPPAFLGQIVARAVPALLGLLHGDKALASWQGSAAVSAAQVEAIVAASGVRARPQRQARDWGYQRLAAQSAVLIADAAPPPVARVTAAGCASTLGFELSHGPHRIIVNCGGAGLTGAIIPDSLSRGLRTTAAHSTLVIDDANSTAILPDGTLGKGVREVELERRETAEAGRLDISHDGYARRFGLVHRRALTLLATGREVRGEDVLVPVRRARRRGPVPFCLRFHLGRGISASLTADGMGALMRIEGGPLWQFRTASGALAIEDSLWVDGNGRPQPIEQLVVSAAVPPGGASIGWLLKHIG